MQRALRAMVEKHRLQRYDPSIPKLGKREHLKEFGDLLLHPHQEKDTENAFDNNEMCEYATSIKGHFPQHVIELSDVWSSIKSREAVHGGGQE